MMTETSTKNIGLRGVTVADSKVSLVDGDNGRLIYRGYAIRELADHTSFAEIVYLLLMGRLPSAGELEVTKKALADAWNLPPEILAMLEVRPKTARPMDVLQSCAAALADFDPDLDKDDRGARVRSALRLIGRMAMCAAAWYNIRQGRAVGSVEGANSHSEAFLRALTGRVPSDDEVRLTDIMLVLHAEHTLNASTFAVREVASTKAHLYACVAAGIGALSGSLHGGANARVMEMLEQIGSLENVEPWVQKRIEAGQRVMGLGHAVYKTEDPRATILRAVAEQTLAGTAQEHWFRLSLEVERVSRRLLKEKRGLDLYPNVDFYSGGVLRALGLPNDFFPVFFAVSRVAGWSAHYIEEDFAEAQPKAVIYRPKANYVGRDCGPQGCRYIPLESRGAGCPGGKEFEGCDEKTAMEE